MSAAKQPSVVEAIESSSSFQTPACEGARERGEGAARGRAARSPRRLRGATGGLAASDPAARAGGVLRGEFPAAQAGQVF